MSDLNNLELRLKRIEDQLELLRLEGAYAYFFDRGEGQEWAALFTEDGVYWAASLPVWVSRILFRATPIWPSSARRTA